MPAHILFEHVPKTAGTTLTTILHRRFPHRRIFQLSGQSPRDSIHVFQRLSANERAGYRLISGHCAIELLDLLPPETFCMTMLRDPVERIVSHYHHVQRSPHHHLHESVRAGRMTLADYAVSGISEELENYMTLTFSRRSPDALTTAPLASLAAAQEMLSKRFGLIGLSERFDESALLLMRRLGWTMYPTYARTNVAPRRPAIASIDAATLQKIQEKNQLDLALYQWAERQFEASLRAEGPGFMRALDRYRACNQVYQKYRSATARPRDAAKRVARRLHNAVISSNGVASPSAVSR